MPASLWNSYTTRIKYTNSSDRCVSIYECVCSEINNRQHYVSSRLFGESWDYFWHWRLTRKHQWQQMNSGVVLTDKLGLVLRKDTFISVSIQ